MKNATTIIKRTVIAFLFMSGAPLANAALHIGWTGNINDVSDAETAQLQLTATDGDGQPVVGLTTDDCRITEASRSFSPPVQGFRFTLLPDAAAEFPGRYILQLRPPRDDVWFPDNQFSATFILDCDFAPFGSEVFWVLVSARDYF